MFLADGIFGGLGLHPHEEKKAGKPVLRPKAEPERGRSRGLEVVPIIGIEGYGLPVIGREKGIKHLLRALGRRGQNGHGNDYHKHSH